LTWVKGQSGNPRGRRPFEPELTPELRRFLHKREPTTGKTHKALIVQALVAAAVAGNLEAIRTVLERIDGKVATPLEHAGGDLIRLAFDYAVAVAEFGPAALAPGSNGHRLPPGPPQVPGDGSPLGQDPDGR
jgi:hypothetical protein